MKNVPFQYVLKHTIRTVFSFSQFQNINMTWTLIRPFPSNLKPNGSVSQSSMVAENLRRMEMQEEGAKPGFENVLKKAATTAIVGK
jgi:hypothetical protein